MRSVCDDDTDDGEDDDDYTETDDRTDSDLLGASTLDYPE
jgi:hypothetical protein